MLNDFVLWLMQHPAFVEGYWFWAAILGVILSVAFMFDAFGGTTYKEPKMRPIVMQSRGHFAAGAAVLLGLSVAALLGWWAIDDNLAALRFYFSFFMLIIITCFDLLLIGLWVSRRLALWTIEHGK